MSIEQDKHVHTQGFKSESALQQWCITEVGMWAKILFEIYLRDRPCCKNRSYCKNKLFYNT